MLWFAGDIDGVNSLRKVPGLEPYTDQVSKLQAGRLERFLVQVRVEGFGGPQVVGRGAG